MQMKSPFKTVGHLAVNLRFPDGRVEKHFEEDNLIVYGGRNLILRPLYTPGAVSDPIATLRVGSGGSIDPQGLYPKAPTVDMVNLYHQDISVPAVSYVFDPGLPSVTFRASVDQSQMNGTLVNEAGLFTTSGIMFNIKTFTGIPKTVDFAVDFEWTISVL